MVAWGGLINSWEKKISERQRRRRKICPSECRLPKNSKEREESLLKRKKWRSWRLGPSLHGKQMGKQWKQWQTFFSWAPKSLWTVTVVMKLKDAPWKKSFDQPRQHIKKQRHHFTDKGQSYGFPSSHVQMWELEHKEGWALKNWCFWTVVLEDSWESLGQQGNQNGQSGHQP